MKTKNYFNQICDLVEDGLTISKACINVGITRAEFYKTIDKKQKLFLNQLRTSTKLLSIKENAGPDYEKYKDLHDFFTLNEYI